MSKLWYHWNEAQPDVVVGKVIIYSATRQKEGVTEGFPTLTARVCVCSLDTATLALLRQTEQALATPFHVTCTHGHRSERKTFLEHPHIHTCFLSPTESARVAPSPWRHRKAKLHVSFSYRGKPPQRHPLFTLTWSRFTRPFVFVICPVENRAFHAMRFEKKAVQRKCL